jgi:hypothetical protein
MALCVSFASRAAKSPADCRRAILVPCPDHSERNSERFCLAARCLRARVRLFCQGMGRMFSGVDSISVIKRLTMPRAGRPEKARVIRVWSSWAVRIASR